MKRANRSTRHASYEEEDHNLAEHYSEQENDEPVLPRGRRPGKEPVNEGCDDHEVKEEEPRQKKSRKGDSLALNQSRVARPPDPDAVRREGGGLLERAAPREALQGDSGPAVVERQELIALGEKMAEYARFVETTRAKFKGVISRQELDNLVRQVMRRMLFLNTEKPGTPVSRAELTKIVSESTTQKMHNISGMVIALAQSKMLEVFGLEIREIIRVPQRGAGKGAAASGEGSKYLVLRSAVPPSLLAKCVQDRNEDSVRGFAAVLLTLIELSGGKLTGGELWVLLGELGIQEEHYHPRFGKPADLLETLIRRRYLNLERQQGSDGEVRIYTAAENALDEIGKENIKEFYETEFARAGAEGGQAAGAAVR